MHQQTLNKFRETVARQREAIQKATDPKKLSQQYLREAGYLNNKGEIARAFQPGILKKRQPKIRKYTAAELIKKLATKSVLVGNSQSGSAPQKTAKSSTNRPLVVH